MVSLVNLVAVAVKAITGTSGASDLKEARKSFYVEGGLVPS